MSKHTPGPWGVRYAKNMTAITTPKGEMQLSLHGIYDGLKPLSVDLQEWQANAALIAAAPELLEALKRLLTQGEKGLDQGANHDGLTNCTALANARHAISQAEGRPTS